MLVRSDVQFNFIQLVYGSRQASMDLRKDIISRQIGFAEFMNSKQWIRFAIRRVI